MKSFTAPGKQTAFTLIELLLSIAIIAILAALVLTSLSSMKKTSLRIEGMSEMRQIAMSIQSFISDHDNGLPGPLWGGQSPWYQSVDIRTLGYQLSPYLGLPKPESWIQEARILSPRAYVQARPSSSAMSFIMNDKVVVDGSTRTPWGYNTPSESSSNLPMRITAVIQAGLASTWALKDVCKTTPEAANAGWRSNLPNEPIYKPYHLQLYFDWHVECVNIP